MKHRYSPAAIKAHLRAMQRTPIVQEVPVDAISKLTEAYFGGFLTRVELVDLVLDLVHAPSAQPEPAPQPPAVKPWWFHTISAEVDDAGELHLTVDGQPAPQPDDVSRINTCVICAEETMLMIGEDAYCTEHYGQIRSALRWNHPDDLEKFTGPIGEQIRKHAQPEPHDEGCQCHLCWAASLTPPSPPWEGGIA